MSEEILKVKNLRVTLSGAKSNVILVDDVNFTVHAGETLALVGESGSGKTMTSLSIMQLLPPSVMIRKGSEIWLRDQNLLQLSEVQMRKIRGCKISMIFQEPMTSLNPVFTIGEQIAEVIECHSHTQKEELHDRIIELLTAVGIKDPIHCVEQYPHELSGGMQQRVMIAMAIAIEPDVLIADEPTSALDVTIQKQVLALLKKIQNKMGMGLLLIAHDLGVVKAMADDVIVMRKGNIVESARAKDFFANPQHAYSKKLFAAIPSYEKRGFPLGELEAIPQKNVIPETNIPSLTVKDFKIYFPIRRGLFKRTVGYVKAVDGIDLDVYPGKTLALIGESGSGKTTAGKGILQLIPNFDGSVSFEGQDLKQLNRHAMQHVRSQIQMIFQDPYGSLNPRMQIIDIIAEGIDTLGLAKNESERSAKVSELLEQVGLDPSVQDRYPHEFSGGQRQRISIARALAVNPKLIICDEPTSALDVSVQAQILNLLKKLQLELGLGYLFITHNMAVVAYLADEVAVMHHGKIVEKGETNQVLKNPQDPYTKKLLDSVLVVN